MTIPDASTLAELIDDCAEIPPALRSSEHLLPLPRNQASWQVNEVCTAQVRDMDDYGA
ncbi:hypothetical protein N8J89_09240 [Crossiella sp. CA-258035]|uniref:hypothetical protein n=1 Tax=Crossiella sp. CA-258035 TaxID=2981138 RepID=UPI0024BC3B3F|nr:hypothetical protein [Crossiella sp. CA-258035]WHT21221.1 hypothetical protein N8J89_09240 [Crossiella sp. CA-258035]